MIIMSEFDIGGLEMSNGSAKSIEDFEDSTILLHGDDSELIFFVDPDEESLGIVMEDTSTRWPVSVKVASRKESVSLLEEDMVVDELLLISGGHTFEWVEFTSKITFESAAGSGDFVHDFESLILGNTWTKWVVSQVSSNSNSSRVDHLGVIFGEFSVFDTIGGHVGDVLVFWAMFVIVCNNLIEQLVESGVRIVRSSINSDTRVLVGNS